MGLQSLTNQEDALISLDMNYLKASSKRIVFCPLSERMKLRQMDSKCTTGAVTNSSQLL